MTDCRLQITEKEKGQSLFEVVVAVAISALIITTIVALAALSIQNSSYSRDKTLASGYVSETMEWLRRERDKDFKVFAEKAGTALIYCMTNLGDVWPAPTANCSNKIAGTKFTRELSFPVCDTCPPDVIEAMVTVSWIDSKGLHEVTSSTDLSVQ